MATAGTVIWAEPARRASGKRQSPSQSLLPFRGESRWGGVGKPASHAELSSEDLSSRLLGFSQFSQRLCTILKDISLNIIEKKMIMPNTFHQHTKWILWREQWRILLRLRDNLTFCWLVCGMATDRECRMFLIQEMGCWNWNQLI